MWQQLWRQLDLTHLSVLLCMTVEPPKQFHISLCLMCSASDMRGLAVWRYPHPDGGDWFAKCFLLRGHAQSHGDRLKNNTAVLPGSGNVAIYGVEIATL